MHQIAYMSRATNRPSRESLNGLCEQSANSNKKAGITGLLVFDRKRYMQVIEGHTQAVQQLMIRIEADDRHDKITYIVNHPIVFRAFEDWTLACVHFGAHEDRQEFMADIKNTVRNVADVRLKAAFIGFASLSR